MKEQHLVTLKVIVEVDDAPLVLSRYEDGTTHVAQSRIGAAMMALVSGAYEVEGVKHVFTQSQGTAVQATPEELTARALALSEQM
jgi:hypothetical protein